MTSLFLLQYSECMLSTQLSFFLWTGHGKLNFLATFQRVNFGFSFLLLHLVFRQLLLDISLSVVNFYLAAAAK